MITEQVEMCCDECKITFWITKKHQEALLRCHNIFYCPIGHARYYPAETTEEKLKRKLTIIEENFAYEEKENKRLARSNSALRGVITRKKKEITGERGD